MGRRCRASPIRDVAKELRLDWHTVKALEQQYMREQLRRAGTPGPRVIGIDEVSIKKGHTYRIVVSDLIRQRPIWFGGTDRSEASLDQFYAWLGPRKAARIRLAVMDMWKPFRLATARHAPQASILFDKFHVLRHLGDALDQVRKSEYARVSGRQRRFIKGQKYTLLSHRENLTLSGRRALKTLLAANKRLNTAYLLKESFGQLWDYGREGWARRFFEHWRAALKWQRLRPYEKFAAMIEALGRHRRVLPPGEQGRARFRRGAEQQDPRPPAPRLRAPRRRVPAAQDPHLHAAGVVTVLSYLQVLKSPTRLHEDCRRVAGPQHGGDVMLLGVGLAEDPRDGRTGSDSTGGGEAIKAGQLQPAAGRRGVGMAVDLMPDSGGPRAVNVPPPPERRSALPAPSFRPTSLPRSSHKTRACGGCEARAQRGWYDRKSTPRPWISPAATCGSSLEVEVRRGATGEPEARCRSNSSV